MTDIETQKIVFDLVVAFGGQEKFSARMDEKHRQFQSIWEQDADQIGRVLRAHIAVEHFLTAYIQYKNSGLGSLEGARLGFAQKIELVSDADQVIGPLKLGLKRLNRIRNHIAHKLKVEIEEEDRALFLSIPIFKAMREASAKGRNEPCDDALSILEQFASFAACLLHSGADSDSEIWKQIFEQARISVQQ
ncbi:hypothetical protein ACK33V_03090 [Aeromonas veronii]|uniref:hypothetical protein n=1 Tax=Aeromonas veronii TaxID=654 RepID=UPI0022304736|nr:hypothetical protein [Aeromonas veronii]EKP0297697.1 hypothetical protein [Aeromonas veronii]UZE57901.1 hypothetical protein ONR73_13295 [Aeromonas veronii]